MTEEEREFHVRHRANCELPRPYDGGHIVHLPVPLEAKPGQTEYHDLRSPIELAIEAKEEREGRKKR